MPTPTTAPTTTSPRIRSLILTPLTSPLAQTLLPQFQERNYNILAGLSPRGPNEGVEGFEYIPPGEWEAGYASKPRREGAEARDKTGEREEINGGRVDDDGDRDRREGEGNERRDAKSGAKGSSRDGKVRVREWDMR